MEYIKSSPNRNINGLDGIYKIDDVKIKLTSKFDDTNEILDCDCIAITEGGFLDCSWGTDQDYNIGYLFFFDVGYIQVVYEKYFDDSDLGALFCPIFSKLVINDEPIEGFFKDISDDPIMINDFMSQTSLYDIMKYNKEKSVKLEFNIGLEMPKPYKEEQEYWYY